MEQLSEKLYDFLAKIPKSYYLPIGLAVAGLILLSIGLIQLLNNSQDKSAQTSADTQIQPTISISPIGGMQVDVEGAVIRPGVYKLPQNARVQDALIAAGGLSNDADRTTVEKSINLAARLTDGIKIYIPKIGDSAVLGATSDTASSGIAGQTGLININSATESQLDNLPGIGPVTAQKIISGRPYASIDDMLSKKVVSNSVFQKIKDKVTIY